MAEGGPNGPTGGPAPTPEVRPRGSSRAFLIYNGLRLGLLAAALGLGWLAGLRGVVLLIVGLAVSGVASWFLLTRQRIAMGEAVELTVARNRDRLAAMTAAEDEYADSLEAAKSSEDPTSSPTTS
jgi:Protein of unknown function (DUF4229)